MACEESTLALCARCSGMYDHNMLANAGIAAGAASAIAHISETTPFTTYFAIEKNVLYLLAVNRERMPENELELETFEYSAETAQANLLRVVLPTPILKVKG
eukprot:1151583-Rhodomonas_salina.1